MVLTGIVLTVSHDRYFLDRVVNRIFAFEGGNDHPVRGRLYGLSVQERGRRVFAAGRTGPGRRKKGKPQQLEGRTGEKS